MTVVYPFTAIVGQEKAKLALLCNAVNPAIGGVLLSGDKGTGKSTMVRALADVLPEVEVVKGCPFNCNPNNELEMCEVCREKARSGEVEVERRRMRVVDLPLSVSVDRLVGTVDIEKALREGIKALQPGILAEANRNILYIDEVNLLDDYIADILLDAAAMGWNVIEREGISLKHPSRFILVGSMNPEEGELRPQILDRFGLYVQIEAVRDVDQRVEIVRRVEEFRADPMAFRRRFEKEQRRLREKIERAREIVSRVEVDDDLLKLLVKTIVDMGIKTHRAEITTIRTAKAIAALDGRRRVSLEDLKVAMELALPHRLKDKPFDGIKQLLKAGERNKEEMESEGRARSSGGGNFSLHSGAEDVDVELPKGEDFKAERTFRGSRDERATVVGHPHGYPISDVPFDRPVDVDLVATIRSALAKGRRTVKPEDIRVRVRKARLPRLTVIILDASGSMAARRRIAIAKGVAKRLIENGYIKRDFLSLIVFRGTSAEVIVPPTKNYTALMSALNGVKVGGKTPLSSALLNLLRLSRAFRLKNRNSVVRAILITDGKANTPVRLNSIKEEIATLAKAIKMSEIRLEIYDTRNTFDPTPSFLELLQEISNARVYRI